LDVSPTTRRYDETFEDGADKAAGLKTRQPIGGQAAALR
jgi:hypothetical protein